jgi:hypothetical protein
MASSYEIFVKRAITGIQKESQQSWNRSKEGKELRDACAQFLSLLDHHEAGTAPVDGATLSVAVLHPLQLACSSNNVRVSDRVQICSWSLRGSHEDTLAMATSC